MAEAIVSISRNTIRIGSQLYRPDDEVESAILAQLRVELGEYLPPREARAKAVARAIRKLHICAIRQCLASTN